MSEHLSASELEQYVIGALGPGRAEEVEAHVMACDACGAALAREARLELAFEQVARALPVAPSAIDGSPRRPRPAAPPASSTPMRFAVVTCGVLSLAAAWMLVLMPALRGAARASASGAQSEASAACGTAAGDATAAACDGRLADRLDGG